MVRMAEVVKAIQDVGDLIHFLPPYSPYFAPIEETCSEVKHSLKSIEKKSNTYVQLTLKPFYF